MLEWLAKGIPSGEEARLAPSVSLREKRVYLKRVLWVLTKAFSLGILRAYRRAPLWENVLINLEMNYYTYILKSDSHGTYYYGQCMNLEKRLAQHNNGRVRYTKGRMPWKLHYFEEFETRSEAMKREKFFKTIDGYNFLKNKEII